MDVTALVACANNPDFQISDWQQALETFSTVNASAFAGNISDQDKKTVIDFIISKLSTDLDPDVLRLSFATLKIISRTRTHLDAIYTSGYFTMCKTFLDAKVESVVPELLGVLQNICSINRSAAVPLFKESKLTASVVGLIGSDCVDVAKTALRLVFVLSLDSELCTDLLGELKALDKVFDRILTEVGDLKQEDATVEAKTDAGNACRQVLLECYRALLGLSWESSSETKPELKTFIAQEKYVLFAKASNRILRSGIEITEEDRAEFADVVRKFPSMIREIDGQTPARVPEEPKVAESDDEPPPLEGQETDEKAEKTSTPEKKQDWEKETFEEDDDPDEKDRSKCTLSQLKGQIALIVAEMLPSYVLDDLRALKALTRMTVRASLCDRSKLESELGPMLVMLTGIAKSNVVASAFIKRWVFGPVAFDDEQQPEGMQPAGPRSKNPYLFKNILLKQLTSFNGQMNQLTGDLLFRLCGEDSGEYIRLTGFGNAVGLLANRGMPGFQGIAQNALSASDLQKMAAEAKKRRGE